MKQSLYPFVLFKFMGASEFSGIQVNSSDVNGWMEKFDGWDEIERFMAINADNGGIVFAYKWGDGWYSSDCLNDCNDFEQVEFREMMAEMGITAEFSNDPSWVRWILTGDSAQRVKSFDCVR